MTTCTYEFERTAASGIGVQYDALIRNFSVNPWSTEVKVEPDGGGRKIRVSISFLSPGDHAQYRNSNWGRDADYILRQLRAVEPISITD